MRTKRSGNAERVLVVDDDGGIVAAIKSALAVDGYEVAVARDGVEALEAFELAEPSLILLDLLMPRLGGLEVCRRIRESHTTPIIVLSVKGREEDIISVLDIGADDYLVKPFRVSELQARVRAVLRRANRSLARTMKCGEIEINSESREVTVAGQPVTLTPTEFTVLYELAVNVGRVLSTRLLLQRVWGPEYGDESDYVKGVIRRLRVKLEHSPAHPRYIITEPHVGYRLREPAS